MFTELINKIENDDLSLMQKQKRLTVIKATAEVENAHGKVRKIESKLIKEMADLKIKSNSDIDLLKTDINVEIFLEKYILSSLTSRYMATLGEEIDLEYPSALLFFGDELGNPDPYLKEMVEIFGLLSDLKALKKSIFYNAETQLNKLFDYDLINLYKNLDKKSDKDVIFEKDIANEELLKLKENNVLDQKCYRFAKAILEDINEFYITLNNKNVVAKVI